MSDESDDLRSIAEDIAEDARRLQAIEEAKIRLSAGDPTLLDLAEEAERLTRRMAAKTTAERELAGDIIRD